MTDPTSSGTALVVRAPGDVALEPRTGPAAAPGRVRIRPTHVGLCGTDLEIVQGRLDPAYVRYPLVLGHEWSGIVESVGDGVDRVRPGQRVVVEGILACGVCAACRAGRTNMCENYDELGFTVDGAAGPAVVVPAHLVHALADGIEPEAGALVEPAAVVLRGLRELALRPGQRVLVVGDGTVALLAAQLVRMWSPARVTISGRRAEQRGLAAAVGTDEFLVDDAVEPMAYDVVVEAAGSPAAVEAAIRAAARGAQVLLLGIAGHGVTANLPIDDLVNYDIAVRGSFSYTAEAWAETVRLLNAGSFRPAALITHRFAVADFEKAFDVLAAGDGGPRGKVLFDLTGGAP